MLSIRPVDPRAANGVVRLFICAALVATGAGALAPHASAEVKWRSGARSVPRAMVPAELGAAMATLAQRPGLRRVVVHFDGPVAPAQREALEASGVRLLSYLGDHAYFATLTEGLDTARASAVPGLSAVEGIVPTHKLHPDLVQGLVHPWAIVSKKEGATEPGAEPTQPIVAVYVLFHRDADLALAREVLARHDGRVQSTIKTVHGVVAHLPSGNVAGLAAEDAVMYVEPPLPKLTDLNDSNRVRVGADVANAPPYGLDGSGVTVLVYDGGKVAQHGDLAGRLTIGPSDTAGTSDHSTHVACTIGGSGAGSGGNLKGMAPGVDIVSYGFEQEGGLQEGFLYTDPGDLEDDYTEAVTMLGADLANNSIGTNTAPNGFPCSWEGNYGVTDTFIDEIARGALGSPFRIVWANGNERQVSTCGSTYHTTAPPACAKNHMTVGAMNSNDDSVTSFTSWGPCDDGRLKPDVSAPGCESGDDGGVTSCSSSGGYTVKCGTSMASPTAAGVAALLLQQYRATFPARADFRNSTLRAVLAHTAVDLFNPGPDYQTGYGSIRAVPAIDLIAEERFVEGDVGQGETYSFLVLVGSGDTELKVTLAWDDPAGTPVVDPALVNDLDLRVIDPQGGVHYPWTLNPANPSAPAVRVERDGVNNIEQVVISAPTPGAYHVEVVGFDVAQGPLQTFSASASPTLINCAPAGIVGTDTTRIACNANLGIEVIDCDLNTDDGVSETVGVSVVSTSEPGGEAVVLTEAAPEAATFLGTLPVSPTNASGVLLVADGDLITVTYIDADNGAGGLNVPVTRQVTVDCTAPLVTSVVVSNIEPRDATVAVTANEPVRLTLSYGTTCGAPTNTAVKLSYETVHTVNLSNLQDNTTYFFTLAIQDQAGNASSDDNDGACYSFTTPEVPDFFTEQFTGGVDLEGSVMTFTPNGSVDFYAGCVEDLTAGLPTDPTGGIELDLGDDQPTSFVLTDGATVSLYGQSYGTIHLGPNGYVTFGAGDSDYSESFTDHFDLPRVAALFDDLNPNLGGTISWKQLADRVAMTWLDIPEYSTSNSNTFQIEMFFDGRIRMSWVDIDVNDAVVGLSEGEGLDPDFLPNDLSGLGACGPRPPVVQDVVASTHIGDPVGIVLTGTDDGLPAPAALTYRITSLPTYGTLIDDGTGLAIAAAPYDLVSGGNDVTYEPFAAYGGPDAFKFVADDGGVPPDGGASDVGDVAISVTVEGEETLHEFLVNDTNPGGWQMTGAWAFGPPTGGGSHNHDPSAGATGANVFGYNLAGDYPNNMGQEFLTSPVLDLTQIDGATLRYSRWLGVENGFKDRAQLLISTNGGSSWSTVWANTGVVSESAWTEQAQDISIIADDKSNVRLRWVMGTTDATTTYPGWNLDDIRITGTVMPQCSSAPDEVTAMTFPSKNTVTWYTDPILPPHPPVFDTLRSGSSSDFVNGAVCVETDGVDGATTDNDVPAGDAVFYYLIRAQNGCGASPLGDASDGSPRSAMSCP